MNGRSALISIGAIAAIACLLVVIDQFNLSRASVNFLYLALSILGYAAVGLICRTTNLEQYFVAGRSIGPIHNGLATAADWLSAASVIGLTGLLLNNGFVGFGGEPGGLVYIMGWTGGFCLLAFFFAEPIRKSKAITIPDFLASHHNSLVVRLLAAVGTLFCSLVYLIAQIYGIGLVASMLSGLTFELGVLLALGGVLLCSFLGGMKAVTWTQVIQAFVILISMLGLVIAVAVQTSGHAFFPMAAEQSIQKLEAFSQINKTNESELSTTHVMQKRVNHLRKLLANPSESYAEESRAATIRLEFLKAINAPLREIHRLENSPYIKKDGYQEVVREWKSELHQLEKQLTLPTSFTLNESPVGGLPLHSIGLFFCLALGTVSLPHLLIRSATTVSPQAARQSMIWTILMVTIVYVCASSLAVMIKDALLSDLLGRSLTSLPAWMEQLKSTGRDFVSLTDWNNDGLIQLGDVRVANDQLILAIPEILGISPLFTGLIAAGALAAALSTADGLLLTISNAIVHDFYFQTFQPHASALRRVMLGKIVLMVVALFVAWITTHKPVDILYWVACAFSLACSTMFPALFLSIHWSKVTKLGLIAAICSGMLVAILYIGLNQPLVSSLLEMPIDWARLYGVDPISAGVFGVPAGFTAGVLVSAIQGWLKGVKAL